MKGNCYPGEHTRSNTSESDEKIRLLLKEVEPMSFWLLVQYRSLRLLSSKIALLKLDHLAWPNSAWLGQKQYCYFISNKLTKKLQTKKAIVVLGCFLCASTNQV